MPTLPPYYRYGIAIVAVGLTLFLWWPFGMSLGPTVLVLLVLIAVLATAGVAGLGPGLLATGLGDVILAGVWLTSSNQFVVTEAAVWGSLILVLAVGAGMSWLGEQIHRADRAIATAGRVAADQHEWLRAALASIDDAVILTDTRERVLLLNPVASLLTGWGPEEAAGKPLGQVVHMVHRLTHNTLDSPVNRALHGGTAVSPAEAPVLVARDGTERRVADVAAPVRDHAGVVIGAVLVCRETGSGPARDREPTPRTEVPAAANPRKDELLAVLAHELGDMRAAIPRGLDILRQGDAGRLAEAHSLIAAQVRRLAQQVDEIVAVADVGAGLQLQVERVDLTPLVRAAVGELGGRLTEGGRTLTVQMPDTPVWVCGDARRLALVLHDLLDNAARAAGAGGHITTRLNVDAGRLQAALSVRGMAAEGPGSNGQRSSDSGGPKWHLVLAEKLVGLHGGEIAVRGEPGEEVTVRLPLEPEPAALSATPHDTHPGAIRLRVLVVEDNRESADSLGLLLRLLGHQVTVAYSGAEAVKVAEECRPHLVLCDIGLPGMDGYHVVQELRRRPATARTHLIAISGHGSEEDRRRAYEAGFDHHLTKPVDPQVLQNVLALETLSTAGGGGAEAVQSRHHQGGPVVKENAGKHQ